MLTVIPRVTTKKIANNMYIEKELRKESKQYARKKSI